MFTDVQNPNALDVAALELTGAYRLFLPTPGSAFAGTPNKPIHLGHVRSPAETTNITTKNIDSAVYGAVVTVLSLTTKIEESGTFETASANDLRIRSLWSGSTASDTANPGAAAVAFQATHPYVLGDLVKPAAANGHYYKVTTAGNSGANEPNWPTGAGSTVNSGGVTFTEQGDPAAANSGPIIIKNTHGTTTGMLIDVYLSAITGGHSEIFVAPAATLRGDGYGAGRDGTNETTLKFAYTLLAPNGYNVPDSIGAENADKVTGGYNILRIAAGAENAIIDALIAGFNTP